MRGLVIVLGHSLRGFPGKCLTDTGTTERPERLSVAKMQAALTTSVFLTAHEQQKAWSALTKPVPEG